MSDKITTDTYRRCFVLNEIKTSYKTNTFKFNTKCTFDTNLVLGRQVLNAQAHMTSIQ